MRIYFVTNIIINKESLVFLKSVRRKTDVRQALERLWGEERTVTGI